MFFSRFIVLFFSFFLVWVSWASQPLPDFQLNSQQNQIATDYSQEILEGVQTASSEREALKRQVEARAAWDRQEWYGIRYGFIQVLKDNPKDYLAWVCLSQALSSKYFGDDKKAKQKAVAAALNAYKVAQNQNEKLIVLGILSKLDDGFDAIYKKQMQSRKDQDIEQDLAAKIKAYPSVFKVYNIDIPERTDTGSACLVWTKPLLRKKGYSFENFISLTPDLKNLGVIAKGNRLCLNGLNFGAAYTLTVKKGLPGEDDYKLEADANIDLLIQHRKPTLQFRERGYILPTHAPHSIPLNAVNVSKAKIKVWRIPVNNLPQQINRDEFMKQLYEWQAVDMTSHIGELVAEGEVDCQSEMDQTTTRGISLEQIIGQKLKSGVYVIRASLGSGSSYEDRDNTTQWLVVSDIGLSTYKGPDGLHVIVRSLKTAEILKDVELTLIARNGRELGQARTDKQGYAKFDAAILQGQESNAPIMIIAQQKGENFTLLNLKNEGFDFSDRGAKGRVLSTKVDTYLFTERGIYHPGDKVNVTALVRDQQGKALTGVPLIFKIKRPDGLEVDRKTTQDQGAGAHTFVFPTQSSAYSGVWTIEAYVDPKGVEVGHVTFRVQDFVPPRINVSVTLPQKAVHPFESLETDVIAHYYYGPAASNLKTTIEIDLVEAISPFEALKDYHFGLEEASWVPQRVPLEESQTDAQGKVNAKVSLEASPDTTKILSARSTVTVYEAGGRGRTAEKTILYWHQPFALGIAAQFKDRVAPENGEASFHIIAVNETGKFREIKNLTYTFYEETRHFTWFRSGNSWNYETSIDDRIINSGNISTDSRQPVSLKFPVKFGHYRLEVMDQKTGVATSFRFHAGWGGQSDLPDRPDLVEVSLDKPFYNPGEKAYLNITAPYEGELFVAALGDHFEPIYHGKASLKGNHLELPLKGSLLQKGGVYLMATVFRPADIRSEKMPGRAIGLIWLDLKDEKHTLNVSVSAPETARPNQKLEIKSCVPKAVKDLYMQVALVDEGILNLTNYTTPDLLNYFFGQTFLMYTVRDSYGSLVNPYGSRPTNFKVGGGGGLEKLAFKNLDARTYKIVSLISPILHQFREEKEGYCGSASFDLPEFSGNLRVMTMAWSPDAMGSTDHSVITREPLETYISLPRFLAPRDEAHVMTEVDNLTGSDGSFSLNIKSEGSIVLKEPFDKKITLAKEQRQAMPLTLIAGSAGVGKILLKALGAHDLKLEKNWDIAIRSPVFEQRKRRYGTLAPDKDVRFSLVDFQEFSPETMQFDISVGSVPTFGSASLIKELKDYPYGCLEQLVSRLAAYLAQEEQPSKEASAIETLINRIVSLQSYDGPFVLWGGQHSAEPWLSVYALDLLFKASHQKRLTYEIVLQRGIKWMQEFTRNSSIEPRDMSVKSYIHYLMAREGLSTLGSLKYFADNHQKGLKARNDLAFIGGAFAHFKDVASANTWFKRAIASPEAKKEEWKDFFQSRISDTAILIKILAECIQNQPEVQDLAMQLADLSAQPSALNTFEKGWLIQAASALSEWQKPLLLTVQDEWIDKNLKTWNKMFSINDLKKPVVLANKGKAPLVYTLDIKGEPKDLAQFAAQGFEIKRQLFNRAGKEIDPAQLKSGDLVFVVLSGAVKDASVHEVLLVELLPAGLEIEQVELGSSLSQKEFGWLTDLTELSRVEKREDRYVATFRSTQAQPFKIAYMARAVTPGTYAYPAASIESMYRPQFSARTPSGQINIKP